VRGDCWPLFAPVAGGGSVSSLRPPVQAWGWPIHGTLPGLRGLSSHGRREQPPAHGDDVPNQITRRSSPDRSKIVMRNDHEIHTWTKHLGVSRAELQRVVEKVGNSAAAVRKELGNRNV
jgi:hypothetical protein